ncbi:MAG: hypothetical protein M0C28_42395 [Candidatus Moduliflexus flocculans]|nr:hypothetical protein [Candidatus Moduliflexus flocculans]
MNKTRAAAAAALLAILCRRLRRPPAGPLAGPRLVAPHGGWVARTLARMTVEEKIGQMVAIRFTAEFRNADSAYLRELESLVVDAGVGGMILFAPAEVRETARLANAFQKLAKVPILMASDFEGEPPTGSPARPFSRRSCRSARPAPKTWPTPWGGSPPSKAGPWAST